MNTSSPDLLLSTSLLSASSSTSSLTLRNLKHTFAISDWIVFVTFLLSSAFIGAFFGWRGRKSKNNKDFLTGNRNLQMFPVVMSLAASFMSTNTILGVPAEVYTLGTQFVIHIVPFTIAVLLSAYVFMPVFYELNMTSVNEVRNQRKKQKKTSLFLFCSTCTCDLGLKSYVSLARLDSYFVQ